MAQIVNTTGVGFTADGRLSLGNEEFVRPMAIGADWGKIRIGLRYAINNNAAHITGCEFVVGVSQGTDLPYRHNLCRDFIGWHVEQPYQNATFTYAAGPPKTFTGGGVRDGLAVTKVAGVVATTVGAAVADIIPGDPTVFLGILFVDIVKNTSSQAVLLARHYSSVGVTNIAQEQFLRGMEDESAYNGLGNATTTVTVTGYTGASLWDSVDIAWNKSSPNELQVSDLYVLRFG